MKESLLIMVCPTVTLSVTQTTPQKGESGNELGQFYADASHHYKAECKKNTHVVLQRTREQSALLENLEFNGYKCRTSDDAFNTGKKAGLTVNE